MTAILQEYRRADIATWPDDRLVAYVADIVSRPRRRPPDSFVLHAPLELGARVALLGRIDRTGQGGAARHERARQRIFAVAHLYDAYSDAIDDPDPSCAGSDDTLPVLAARLLAAIAAGDLDTVDATVCAAAGVLNAADAPTRAHAVDALTRALVDDVVPRTAAAGHAPIYLHQQRSLGAGALAPTLLRPLARSLASEPTWRIAWIDARPDLVKSADLATPLGAGIGADDGAPALFAALAATPRLGVPGSAFIHPLMSQVDSLDRSGVAASRLGAVVAGLGPQVAGRAILRAAALSMLAEPPEHAPYGWSHCLTMPLAVLGVAPSMRDPARGVAVAATHVVGFRAALAVRPLAADWQPEPAALPWRQALDHDPSTAAAAVWFAGAVETTAIERELATRAAVAHDAHLVKYTLACLDAATTDPAAGHLYRAAAASLGAWWAQAGDRDDVLTA